MITEPELTGGSGGIPGPAGLLGRDAPRPPREPAARPHWAWASGGVAAASALWAVILLGTGYGHTAAPDLHGYHLVGGLCAGRNLEPLAGALKARTLAAGPAAARAGTALDHASCSLTGRKDADRGWAIVYTVTVTVDLHRRTDPRGEFEDVHHLAVSTLLPAQPEANAGGTSFSVVLTTGGDDTRVRVPGLGDSAYLTSGKTRQELDVLHGGAVLSLTVDAANQWRGGDVPPVNPDGTPPRPALLDITPLRPELPRTMRRLMGLLGSPPPPAAR